MVILFKRRKSPHIRICLPLALLTSTSGDAHSESETGSSTPFATKSSICDFTSQTGGLAPVADPERRVGGLLSELCARLRASDLVR